MRGMIRLVVVVTMLFCINSSAGVMKYAGCRQSAYGPTWTLSKGEWGNVMQNMASYYPGSAPSAIWIVGTLSGNTCNLEFPGSGIANATFSSDDRHEAFLSHFDGFGGKIFLQVEPGDADISALIDAVLGRYKSHQSVAGFCVDVEWYKNSVGGEEGKPVTDAEAQAWEAKVKSHNPNYKLALKHWEVPWMPPTYRGDIVFVNDHQEMESLFRLSEYWHAFARDFSDNTVIYQGGYEEDYDWWGMLSNPPKDIGDALCDVMDEDQEMGMIWVDFSLHYDEVSGLFDSDFTPSKLEVRTTTLNPGTITLSPSGGKYDIGTEVTATATPSPRALFRAWAGSISGTDKTIKFNVNKNMNITALFGYDIQNITDMLDDFEDGDNLNIIGGKWFSDDGNAPDSGGMTGNSTITPPPDKDFVMTAGGANGSKYAAKVSYTIGQGDLIWYAHVGYGTFLNATGPNLGNATGLSFYHKGRGCFVQYETSDVLDTAYYYHRVQRHTDWTLVALDLSKFRQPTDWGKVVDFKPENGTKVSWKIEDRDGTQEEAWIDDVRITGLEFNQTVQAGPIVLGNYTPAASMKVFNKTLQVSYNSMKNRQVKIAIFSPEGKMVKEISNISSNKERESALIDISSLASGLYIVKLQSGEKGVTLLNRKFIYTN